MVKENTRVRLLELEIAGWKSIQHLRPNDLMWRGLNVVIGANGAGKSNLVSFFDFARSLSQGRLRAFVGSSGGVSSLLHYGPKTTDEFRIHCLWTVDEHPGELVHPNHLEYDVTVRFREPDSLYVESESIRYLIPFGDTQSSAIEPPHGGSGLEEAARSGDALAEIVFQQLSGCRVYHFHDTSREARIRRSWEVHDNQSLNQDGSNLAAMLYRFQQADPVVYRRIRDTIRLIAPFFDDFVLAPTPENEQYLLLNWRDRESDLVFGPHQLSDGTLRAMALITLLLQREADLPHFVVIDEPELGLHPAALGVVAGLIHKASFHCQVLVATQSTGLLQHIDPVDVIVVDRKGKESTFKRLDPDDLKEWLEDYSLGELWEKYVIGGGPF